ncbi:MAG TPA: SurA N-terminal domain-containing protein [Sporichthyaceae bacterium]|jgi:hypothetical protein|nr:SurA N-terminal domain-containing protein [Sporichthyaceae bacterium]
MRVRKHTSGLRVGAAAATMAVLVAMSGCSLTGSKGVPAVAAHVDGVAIDSKTIQGLYNQFATSEQGKNDMDPTQQQGMSVSPKQIRQTALTYQIRVVFLEALAKQKGIDVPATEESEDVSAEIAQAPSLASAGFKASDIRIAQRAEKLERALAVKLLPDVVVNPDEIQAAYDQRKDIVGKSFRATTGIAFMDDLDSANSLKAQLDKGGDWNTIISSLGEKVLRSATVDMSPISPVQRELIDKVSTLKQGETADPQHFEVDNGSVYIVLHVAKREDLPELSLADATPELTKIVQDDKRYQFFQQWFDKQFKEADVKVDGYYGKWNRSFLAVT